MNKLHSAESLRGLACLAVVFSHLLGVFYPQLHNFAPSTLPKFEWIEWIHNSPFAFFYSGTGAVFVFFVLSGYVLTLSTFRAKNQTQRLKESLIKRYPRLAIPAIASCILMWLALHINVDVSHTSEWFQSIKIEPHFLDAVYVGAIGSFFFGEQNYNPVLWTMQIELLGSLVIYFACYFQQKTILKFVFLIISIIISAYISGIAFLGIISFILGHFLYSYQKKLPESLCLILFIFGLYLCGVHNDSSSYTLFKQILGGRTYDILNFAGGFCIVLATLKSDIINQLLDKKPLVHLGKLSFSIYLLHIMVIYLIGVPIFNFMLNSGLSFVVASFISICSVLAITPIFSHFYSLLIDDFAIKFSSKLYKAVCK